MTRPTRPAEPPFPDDEPPEGAQPRFTPRPPESPPTMMTPPGYQPPPPPGYPPGLVGYAEDEQPLAPPPGARQAGPSFTPHAPGPDEHQATGPRHSRNRGSRPQPTFTPREGYVPAGDRSAPGRGADIVPAAGARRLPAAVVPALRLPEDSPPAPRFVPAGRTAQQAALPAELDRTRILEPDARPAPAAASAAACGREHLAQPGPVEQGDGHRHARVPGNRVPAHVRVPLGARPLHHAQRLQHGQHAAQHRLLPDARRRVHLGRGADAGPGGQGGPGPGPGVREADLLPRRDLPARDHGPRHRAGPADRQPLRRQPGREERVSPHCYLRLHLHPADLLLRDGLAARRHPQRARPVRPQHVDPGHQQRRRDLRRHPLRGDRRQTRHQLGHHLRLRHRVARHRHHARHRHPVDRAVPDHVAGRLRHEADLRLPPRGDRRDRPDVGLDVRLRVQLSGSATWW